MCGVGIIWSTVYLIYRVFLKVMDNECEVPGTSQVPPNRICCSYYYCSDEVPSSVLTTLGQRHLQPFW